MAGRRGRPRPARHAAAPNPVMSLDPAPFVSLASVSKHFGGVRALVDADLAIGRGERLAVIGHNGAGKSTLVNLLLGVFGPTHGTIGFAGRDVTASHTVAGAFSLGVRCVFQELSLCPNLTVYENLALQHAPLRRPGWRRQARRLMRDKLDEIFPGNGIEVDQLVSRLSISERQMVEIARAFVEVGAPIGLVILDEPTSSLDSRTTDHLLVYLRRAADGGVAVVFISHRLREVLELVERVVVMRDGRVVADRDAARLERDDLVSLMGGEAEDAVETAAPIRTAPDAGAPPILTVGGRGAEPLELRPGEIVGLAGLEGHGQRDLLHAIFAGGGGKGRVIACDTALTYVSGDRHTEGVFPLWSVGRNITAGLIDQLRRFGLLLPSTERRVVGEWMERLAIRAPDGAVPILSLSGGNQQKVLIARAFASEASLILLDDPTRGVDVGTKKELYLRVREEADRGRGFLWYTTELDELEVCDRVYVFYEGRISDHLGRDELTEDRLLRASFERAPADG